MSSEPEAGPGVICGLKLSHDGGVAVIEHGRLRFSIEREKVGNGQRYAALDDLAMVESLLEGEGLSPRDVDAFVVDGWVRFGDGARVVDVTAAGARRALAVAGYDERRDPMAAGSAMHVLPGQLPLSDGLHPSRSYLHATDHVLAAYCTSPFAAAGAPALVLVWDGGMPACLYAVDPVERRVDARGVVLDVSGSVYPIFASHLEPFALPTTSHAEDYLPVSGKAMAYAGLGEVVPEAIACFTSCLAAHGHVLGRRAAYEWTAEVLGQPALAGLGPADLLASFQAFLLDQLLTGLKDAIGGSLPPSLCLSGGCALNIRWNSGVRQSDLVDEVWVPPFPNDAGSAIGAACTEMFLRTPHAALSWDVFSGPAVRASGAAPPGWRSRAATLADVAAVLHRDGTPVVVLSGRAELGPRALGHRSIVAPATDAAMRDHLNDLKGREWYRPVAPICLEARAPEIFDPGGRDPYMLFDHRVRPGWLDRIPAVVHRDGTARLQTVARADNPVMAGLLEAYERLSGVPVLCNTSANLNSRGFFPDVATALDWGRVQHVWCDGELHSVDGAGG